MVKIRKSKLQGLDERVRDIYIEIQLDIIEEIVKEIQSHMDKLDPIEHATGLWKLQALDQLGILEKNMTDNIIKRADLLSNEIKRLFERANIVSMENFKDVEEALRAAGKEHLLDGRRRNPSDIGNTIMRRYQRQAERITNLTNQTLIDSSKQMYIDGLDKVASEIQLGLNTHTNVIRSLINDWTAKGIPVFTDKAGRNWSAESYLGMVMKTQSTNMVRETTFEYYREYDIELIEISKHPGDRPGCAPYAGGIFSLQPGHKKYPYLYDPMVGRIGDPDSLFGINCGHVSYPYIDGITPRRHFPSTDPELDAEIYKESQEQRRLEREIRNAKARERMLREVGDIEGANRMRELVRRRQARMRAFIARTGRSRRYDREGVWSSTGVTKRASTSIPGARPTATQFNIIDGHVLPNLSQSVQKALDERESAIRYLENERAIIVDGDGHTLWQKDGGRNYVVIDEAIWRGYLRGNILTHNHPSGGSFSKADINVLLKHEIKEIRAAGSNKLVYRARFDDSYKTSEEKAIARNATLRTLEKGSSMVDDMIQNFIWSQLNSGNLDTALPDIEHQHLLWTALGNVSGFKYRRETHDAYKEMLTDEYIENAKDFINELEEAIEEVYKESLEIERERAAYGR